MLKVKRNGRFGSGKTLLGSLSIALKGYAISTNTDYKIIGKSFCDAFNMEIKETTANPYKAFSSGNPKIVREFKRAFNIK